VVVGVEVLRGGVGHAGGHGGCLGQNPGAVDGLRKMGGVRRSGGRHVEFVVGGAHRHQRLLDPRVLAVTVQRLAAHDQLTFGGDPGRDGDRVRSGQPQRLQVHAVYRDERDVAGQPRAGVRRPAGQRDALDRVDVPRLRQEVCARRRGTADSNAALAAVLEEVDLPRAVVQAVCETCKCPVCILDLGDDLEERTTVQIQIFCLSGAHAASRALILYLCT